MSCAPCKVVLEEVAVLLSMLTSDRISTEARFQARRVAAMVKVAGGYINDRELDEAFQRGVSR